MDDISTLLRTVIDSNDTNTLRCYLSSCSEQRTFLKDNSTSSSIASLINTKLNEPSSRYHGLLLLKSFLPQCSEEILASNALTWMQFCLKSISSFQTSHLAFEVLETLFKLTKDLPEMTKVVSASIVPNLADSFNRGSFPQSLLQALECLEQCFSKYNGPCGPHKKVWYRFLIPFVDYSGPQAYSVVKQAARCVALLPQTGGGGTGGTGSMYACSWNELQNAICRSIHLIFDELYSDVNEVQIFQCGGMLQDCEPLELPKLEYSNPIHHVQMLSKRLSGLVFYLRAMLVGKFPVPKKIAVSSILNLICRGLAVNNTSFNMRRSTYFLALESVLPIIHLSLINLLGSLIVLCRSNLFPFASLVCKLAMQTLKWTWVEKWQYGTEKPFSRLRTQTYKLITLWCGVAKRGSLINDVADQLTHYAVSDFLIESKAVSLSADLSSRNKYANRKQSKPKNGSSNFSNGSQENCSNVGSISVSANLNMCIAALQTMAAMLTSAASVINPSVHKMLQESVSSALIDVIRKNSQVLIPFSSNAARLELYRVLLALVLNPHPVWPPPLGLSMKLFTLGLNDKDALVSTFCTSALISVEKIIHPTHSSLNFHVPLNEICAIANSSQTENDDSHHNELSSVIKSNSSADPQSGSSLVKHINSFLIKGDKSAYMHKVSQNIQSSLPSSENNDHGTDMGLMGTSDHENQSDVGSSDAFQIMLVDDNSKSDIQECVHEVDIAASEEECSIISDVSKGSHVSLLCGSDTVTPSFKKVFGEKSTLLEDVDKENVDHSYKEVVDITPSEQGSVSENVGDESYPAESGRNSFPAVSRSPVRESNSSPTISPRMLSVLRSPTISNSSSASTPMKKKPHLLSSLQATSQVEEVDLEPEQETLPKNQNDEPHPKRLKFDGELDDKLDEMLASFVDRTRGFKDAESE